MRKYIIILIILLTINTISALSPSFYYNENNVIDIKIPCVNNGNVCGSSTDCNISIFYPNTTLYGKDINMSNNGVFHNYTLNDNSPTGTYQANTVCCESGVCGFSTFAFEINNTGKTNYLNITGILAMLLGFITICLILTIFFSHKQNTPLKYLFLELMFIFITLLFYVVWKFSQELSINYGGIFYAIYFVSLILTFLMFLIIMLDATVNVMQIFSQKKKKDFNDNL